MITDNKISSITITVMGLVGISIAAYNNTWQTLIMVGGGGLALYFILEMLIGKVPYFHHFTASILAVLGSMVVYQAKGDLLLLLIIFPLLIVLIVYKDWKVYIPFVTIVAISLILIVSLQKQEMESVFFHDDKIRFLIIFIGLLLISAVLCSIFAEYVKTITFKFSSVDHQLVQLLEYEQTNLEFAKQISSGNFDVTYQLKDNDILGQSLVEMSKNLKQADIEEKQRNWSVEGVAAIADILRMNHQSMDDLAYHVVSHLVKYLRANQGGIFILNNDDKNDVFLELKGCYAYERRKYLKKQVKIGEGLVGQVYLEREMIYLIDVPDDYIHIRSGLGDAPPRSIVVVPLKLEEQVVGIIEIASFKEFLPHERQFLLKVSENIASAIISSVVKDQTDRLLKESQANSEEMRAQEEEMRQNMEELQATQESLHRESAEKEKMQREIEKVRDFLQRIINGIPIPFFVKEAKEHRILMVNQAWTDRYKMYNVIGKNDFDLFPKELAQQFYNDEDEVFLSRTEKVVEERIECDGKIMYNLTKKRVIENEDGEIFLVGINQDITDIQGMREDLAKEKYLLDALMNNVFDKIYFKDLESKFIRVSKNMIEAFKVKSQDEIIGKSDFDFFTEEHARPAYETEQEIIRTQQPILNLLEKETWDDGRFSYVSTSKMPLIDHEGKSLGTFGITRDVTQSKLAELEVQKNEKSMAALFQYISDSIILIDDQMVCKFASPSILDYLNLKNEDVVKNSLWNIIHSQDKEIILNVIEDSKKDKEANLEIRFKNNKGGYVKLNLEVINACNEDVQGVVLKVKIP